MDKNNLQQCREFLLPLTIWIPPDVYKVVPILLPQFVRSAKTFKERGTPNHNLFPQDENTVLKDLGKKMRVTDPRHPLLGKWQNTGWAVAHILPVRWFTCVFPDNFHPAGNYADIPAVTDSDFIDSEMYSFTPNLFWVPWSLEHHTNFKDTPGEPWATTPPLFNQYLWLFSLHLYRNAQGEENPHYDHCHAGFRLGNQLCDNTEGKKDEWKDFFAEDSRRVTFFDVEPFFTSPPDEKGQPLLRERILELREYADVLGSYGEWEPSRSDPRNEKRRSIYRYAEGIRKLIQAEPDLKGKATAICTRWRNYCDRCESGFKAACRTLGFAREGTSD